MSEDERDALVAYGAVFGLTVGMLLATPPPQGKGGKQAYLKAFDGLTPLPAPLAVPKRADLTQTWLDMIEGVVRAVRANG